MAAITEPAPQSAVETERPGLARAVWGVAGLVAVILLLVADRYGFHGDEFYFVVTGRHLQVALDVLRHRVAVSYEAEAENISSTDITGKVLETLPVP